MEICLLQSNAGQIARWKLNCASILFCSLSSGSVGRSSHCALVRKSLRSWEMGQRILEMVSSKVILSLSRNNIPKLIIYLINRILKISLPIRVTKSTLLYAYQIIPAASFYWIFPFPLHHLLAFTMSTRKQKPGVHSAKASLLRCVAYDDDDEGDEVTTFPRNILICETACRVFPKRVYLEVGFVKGICSWLSVGHKFYGGCTPFWIYYKNINMSAAKWRNWNEAGLLMGLSTAAAKGLNTQR